MRKLVPYRVELLLFICFLHSHHGDEQPGDSFFGIALGQW